MAVADDTRFFSVDVEYLPSDIDADVSIRVNTLPLCLVYDHVSTSISLALYLFI